MPFILREPHDERLFPNVLSEVEGRAHHERSLANALVQVNCAHALRYKNWKRSDWGVDNMNHIAINDVLAKSFVLPLNSPGYYAPYNGAIEESQRELKRSLRNKLVSGLADSRDYVCRADSTP